jgi:hypothetical protein
MSKKRTLFVIFLALVLIPVLLNYAFAGEKVLYNKIKTIEPEDVNGQYCYVKVIIKQKGDEIMKEEILECADGKRGPETPGYWELFAEFYYHDINTPEYCRYYSRPNHAFKSFGKVCLQQNGEWEVR